MGRSLDEVPTPSAVLDLAKVEANCARMLDTVRRLGIGWRAHIKTHKVGSAPRTSRRNISLILPGQTTELTRLQVGDADSTPVHLAVSTLVEGEKILPL